MLFLLLSSVFSADNFPVFNDTCNYFNTYSYECQEITNESITVNYFGLPQCPSSEIVNYTDGTLSCVSYNQTNVNNIAVTNTSTFTFPNTLSFTSEDGVVSGLLLSSDHLDFLNQSSILCNNHNNSVYSSCQFLASSCALSMYYPRSSSCSVLDSIITSTSTGYQFNYEFWPKDRPFIEYDASGSRVLDESFITNEFTSRQVITIYLATYNYYGAFLGFRVMNDELQKCSEFVENTNSWRIFGTTLNRQCSVNITDLYRDSNNFFFDPFLAETIDDQIVLRPLPIMVKNYLSSDNVAVNNDRDSKKHRFFRRFFVSNTNATTNHIIYLSNATIVFPLEKTSTNNQSSPYFILTYDSSTTSSSSTVKFVTNTVYTRSLSNFYFIALVVVLVCGVFGILLWFFRSYIIVRHYGEDGIDLYVILGALGELVSIAGIVLFLVCFGFSFYIFVCYKWVNAAFIAIPNSNEFDIIIPISWLSFACLLVAIFIKAIMQIRADTFVIDWEPKKGSVQPSAWRRIMIANDWTKLLTARTINLPFTLICIVFILDGLNIDLINQTIPSSALYDVGTSYYVLRFAFTSFLFIIFYIVGYGVQRLLWLIFGSPISNFIDLCITANCSVLALLSRSWGFYLHGRSVNQVSEVDMGTLKSDMVKNYENNISGIHRITDDQKDRVFEVFLHENFRESLSKAYERVLDISSAKTMNASRACNFASISVEAMAAFEQLNAYLCKFFGEDEEKRSFILMKERFLSRLFGFPPDEDSKTIMFLKKDGAIRGSMLAGVEYSLCIFELLLFAGTHSMTDSAIIAGFTTYICDQIILALFRQLGRSNIARKALLDERFIIN